MRVLLDIIRQSLATLWAHKMRSFLTMFVIAWGVGSLLLLVGLGEGFRSGQKRQLATLGQDIMFVFPGRPAVGATLLLNGIRFDVIGVLAKVGQEGNNGTNGRIFVPVETMRNLFPLKEKNTENAISFINYRPLNKAEHLRSKEEVHRIIARLHG